MVTIIAWIALMVPGCGDNLPPLDPPSMAPAQAGRARYTFDELDGYTRVAWPALEELSVHHHGSRVPAVEWVTGDLLTCAWGQGFTSGPPNPDGNCYGGLFDYGLWEAFVALPEGQRIQDSALVHELCHGVAYFSGGDGDPLHTGPCFVPGGWVDQVNAMLAPLPPGPLNVEPTAPGP